MVYEEPSKTLRNAPDRAMLQCACIPPTLGTLLDPPQAHFSGVVRHTFQFSRASGQADFSILACQTAGVTTRSLSDPPAAGLLDPGGMAMNTHGHAPGSGSLSAKLSLREGSERRRGGGMLAPVRPAPEGNGRGSFPR